MRTRAVVVPTVLCIAFLLVVTVIPRPIHASPIYEDTLNFRDETDGPLKAEVHGSWINDSDKDGYKTWEVVITFTNVDDEDHWSPEDFQAILDEPVQDPETNEQLDELAVELRVEPGTKYVMEPDESHTFRYGASSSGSGAWSEFPAEADIHAFTFGAHQQCTDDQILRSAIVDAIRAVEGGDQAADEMEAEFEEMPDRDAEEFWSCDRFQRTNCLTSMFSERPIRQDAPTMYYGLDAELILTPTPPA